MSLYIKRQAVSFGIGLLSLILCLSTDLLARPNLHPLLPPSVGGSVVNEVSFSKSSFNSTLVPIGSRYHRYAKRYCQGSEYNTIYLLNEGGDLGQAVLERYPKEPAVEYRDINGSPATGESSGTEKPERIQQTLFIPEAANKETTPSSDSFENPADSALFLASNNSTHRFTMLPHFVSGRPLRIGFCGVDSTAESLLNAYSAILLQGAPESFPRNSDTEELALTEIQADWAVGVVRPTNAFAAIYLKNVDLRLYHLFLHFPSSVQIIDPVQLKSSRLIGQHVKVTRDENPWGLCGLFVSAKSQIEFTDSELHYGSRAGIMFSLFRDNVSIERTKINIGGVAETFVTYFDGSRVILDDVHFTSHGSARVFNSKVAGGKAIKVSNTSYKGHWDNAFQLANTTILPGSVNNDFSQATGSRCRAPLTGRRKNTGEMSFTDGIGCPGIEHDTVPPL